MQIEGYASRFAEADDGGDIIQRGAFLRSLVMRPSGDVKMLWQHDPSRPIGKWTYMREDGEGLFVVGEVLDGVAQGREANELIRAGVLNGLSIGFKARKARRDPRTGCREVLAVDLWEVSLVTFPLLRSARLQPVL
ncbi:HK97 family phage prohead protease [Pseudovibrio exalbescens]|uniref:HK97 family phage prohead protease n=1 Tax=Pseudovibrio exalbescens TaxID=197461 RepID=UPI0023670443|nr:HK97 family phage prohead protease [Pseudovibrio exalbescens]MDD7909146.1 HK97 family phage prohead protease [Pseudovibrio exalbescens]